MAYCLHGSYYWRTDKAGRKFRYCRICDAVVMPTKKPKPMLLKYTGHPRVNAGACIHCGCDIRQCECRGRK